MIYVSMILAELENLSAPRAKMATGKGSGLHETGDSDATALQYGFEQLPPPFSDGAAIPSAPPMLAPEAMAVMERDHDPPPPYPSATETTAQSMRSVKCRVCNNNICVEPGSHLVKCTFCHEATAVAPPPAGKRYARCVCKCLLVCSASATKIICPRTNCNRTLAVIPGLIHPQQQIVAANRVQVVCGCCKRSIAFPKDTPLSRCPYCKTLHYNAVFLELYVNEGYSNSELIGLKQMVEAAATSYSTIRMVELSESKQPAKSYKRYEVPLKPGTDIKQLVEELCKNPAVHQVAIVRPGGGN